LISIEGVLQYRDFFSFLLVAILIIFEVIAMDSLLSIVVASSPDSHAFRGINNTSSERIQMNSGDTKVTESNTNVNSGSDRQQRENDTSIAIAPVASERIMPNSLSPLSLSLPLPPVSDNNNTCIIYDSINRTINLCGGSADLSTIDQVINSSDILNNTSDKNWILNANISVEDGATLFINSTDADWLMINSTAGRAYSIVVYGNLIIDRTKISSWNSTSNTETALSDSANKSTPRGYLLMHWGGTGHMNITNSNISNLGFNSVKDTWGIAYYSGSGSILQNNSITSNFRGVYLTTNASNIVVANNTIHNSSQHGLNLYKAKDTKILDNKISNNKEHGIFCTRECKNILIKSNSILDNGRNGIVLNQNTTNSTVKQNIVKYNNRFGIAIWNSSNNIVNSSLMQQNGLGITIAQNSSYNIVNNNSIANSLSNGMLLDTNSTKNKIERNLITRSGEAGVYIRNVSDNILVRNDITEHSKNGMVLFNATGNELVSNNVMANAPYNYYIRPNSKLNVIRDTYFDNATLRFFDNSTNIILENTDNRITSNNDKRNLIRAYPTNATLLIKPTTKNVPVNSLDVFVIPSTENLEIFPISKDFDANQKYKRWLERSPLILASASDDTNITSTRYIIGNFAPDTQIMIRVNNSFWNAYTSNSSGYIDFVYDGYKETSTSGGGEGVDADLQSYRVLEFEAEASNRPTIAVFTFFSALIVGSIAFIVVRRYLKKKKNLDSATIISAGHDGKHNPSSA
jgi:parallel beta-helix repeat protein